MRQKKKVNRWRLILALFPFPCFILFYFFFLFPFYLFNFFPFGLITSLTGSVLIQLEFFLLNYYRLTLWVYISIPFSSHPRKSYYYLFPRGSLALLLHFISVFLSYIPFYFPLVSLLFSYFYLPTTLLQEQDLGGVHSCCYHIPVSI